MAKIEIKLARCTLIGEVLYQDSDHTNANCKGVTETHKSLVTDVYMLEAKEGKVPKAIQESISDGRNIAMHDFKIKYNKITKRCTLVLDRQNDGMGNIIYIVETIKYL